MLGGPMAKAVFAGSERWGSLLASGGTAPLHVHMWSLVAEQCVQQVFLCARAWLTSQIGQTASPLSIQGRTRLCCSGTGIKQVPHCAWTCT